MKRSTQYPVMSASFDHCFQAAQRDGQKIGRNVVSESEEKQRVASKYRVAHDMVDTRLFEVRQGEGVRVQRGSADSYRNGRRWAAFGQRGGGAKRRKTGKGNN